MLSTSEMCNKVLNIEIKNTGLFKIISIVLGKPHTGRTHQIRVHLQYLGYPILNDPIYNSDVWGPNMGKGAKYDKTKEQVN